MIGTNEIVVSAALMSGAAAAALAWSVFMPSSNMFSPVFRTLADKRTIALTFDDGPTEPFTSQILDILAEHQARATFFVIGRNVQSAPKLLRRMVDEGHAIGNHSWNHHHFGICSGRAYWRSQLDRTNRIAFDASGARPTLYRPPMGFKTWHMAAAVRQLHMHTVGWSLRSFDTRDPSPETITSRIAGRLSGGEIVMLHDGTEPTRQKSSRQSTVRALPSILQAIVSQNLNTIALESRLLAQQPAAIPA